MFLTASDFDLLPYSIPNLEAVPNTFQDYVNNAEEEALKSLLGKSLYDAFIAGLDEDYPEDRWVELRDGADYILNDRTYEWVGVKKLLTPYVYSMWLRDTFDNHSGIGVVQGNAENSKVVNPSRRIARAYNAYSDIAGGVCDLKNTLYGFLKQEGAAGTFDDTFDESFQDFQAYLNFVFNDPGAMNEMNI